MSIKRPKPINLGRNSDKWHKARTALLAKAAAWQEKKTALDAINSATGEKFKDLKEVNDFLEVKTGFPNKSMGALAFNVQTEYEAFVKAANAKLSIGDFETDSDGNLITGQRGEYVLTNKAMKRLTDENSDWIDGENLQIYRTMKSFEEFYNALPPRFRNGGAMRIQGIGDMKVFDNRFKS